MGRIVSLSRVRKAKARIAHEEQAAANRAAFGRTGAQKDADAQARARREMLLDGAKRDDVPGRE